MQSGATGSTPLVLIVDDNPDTLEMYAIGLRHEGFRVALASDGAQALAALDGARPDCIVTDIRMPHMTGFEFRRALSERSEAAGIPVIALTALSAAEDLATARAAGFDSVLVKPCLPELLAREVVRLTRH